MKVLFCFADSGTQEFNTTHFRAVFPMLALQEAGHECKLAFVRCLFLPLQSTDNYGVNAWANPHLKQFGVEALWGKDAFEAMKWADVVVLERLIIREIHTTIKWLRALGKKVFATFDDAYHLMPLDKAVVGEDGAVVGAQGTWRGGKKALGGRGSFLSEFRTGLSLCNGVLVPSKVLQQDYRQYNPNIHFIPNFLRNSMWDKLPERSPDSLVLGWGGSSHHATSWSGSGLIPALSQICRNNNRVQVHIQPPYPDVVGMFEKSGVRYRVGYWQSLSEWAKTVVTFKIGLAPLDGMYDKRRSSLRVQEFAMAGVPWVASNDSPYQTGVKGGILVSNKPKEWQRAIESLLSRPDLYNRLSEEGRTWARELNSKAAETYEKVFGA